MHKPLIVEIHLLVAANSLKSARAKVIAVLKDDNCRDFSLTPLYVNSDIEDTELRICAQIEEPDKLGEFVAKKIRKIKGVIAARVRLTLLGEIFPEGVRAQAKMGSSQLSGHVFLNTSAGQDERVWSSLRKLKKDTGVLPVWIFRDFYEYDRDITLRVIGREEKQIRAYIDKYLGNMRGILSWRLKFTYDSVKLLGEKELFALAGNWFARPALKNK